MAERLELSVDARWAKQGFDEFARAADGADKSIENLAGSTDRAERELDGLGNEAKQTQREVQGLGREVENAGRKIDQSNRGVSGLGRAYGTAKLSVDKFNEALGIVTGAAAAVVLGLELWGAVFGDAVDDVDQLTEAIEKNKAAADGLRDSFDTITGASLLGDFDVATAELTGVQAGITKEFQSFLGARTNRNEGLVTADRIEDLGAGLSRLGVQAPSVERLRKQQEQELLSILEATSPGGIFDSSAFQAEARRRGVSLDGVLGGRGGVTFDRNQRLFRLLSGENPDGVSPDIQFLQAQQSIQGAPFRAFSGATGEAAFTSIRGSVSSALSGLETRSAAEQAGEEIGESIVRGARRAAGLEGPSASLAGRGFSGSVSPGALFPEYQGASTEQFGPGGPQDVLRLREQERARFASLPFIPEPGDGEDGDPDTLSPWITETIGGLRDFAIALRTGSSDVKQSTAQLVASIIGGAVQQGLQTVARENARRGEV